MTDTAFQRIDVETAPEFLAVISPLQERWHDGNWFYRGVRSAAWNLTPSMFHMSLDWATPASAFHIEAVHTRARAAALKDPAFPADRQNVLLYREREWRMLRIFLLRANHYGFPVPDYDYWWTTAAEDKEIDDALLRFGRWPINRIMHQLAFAQHHGVQTRLLDWSLSPYLAAWFAASEAVKWLYGHLMAQNTLFYSQPDDARFSLWAIDRSRQESMSAGKATLEIILPSYHLNTRIHAQKGAFTLLRSEGDDAELELLPHDIFIRTKVSADRPLLLHITAPHRIAPDVLEALSHLGVTRATIYPEVASVPGADQDAALARILKGMTWLEKPETHYLPPGAKPVLCYLTEQQWQDVERCRRSGDRNSHAIVRRLLERGLSVELSERTTEPSPTIEPSTEQRRRERSPATKTAKAKANAKGPASKKSASKKPASKKPASKKPAKKPAAKSPAASSRRRS